MLRKIHLTITEHGNHEYTIENKCCILTGICGRINENTIAYKINSVFSKEDNKKVKRNAKRFKEDSYYFIVTIRKYAKNFSKFEDDSKYENLSLLKTI
jgi:hypothetical protein